MSISFVGSETKQAAGTTSLTCNVPAGVAEDDFLLAFCYHDATSGSTGAWGLPSGWTVLEAQNHQTGGRDRDTAIFYRIASASEASSHVFSHTDSNEQSSVSINAWRGVDPVTPFDVTYSRASHSLSKTNDPTPAQASITTATDNALVVILSAQTHDDITAVGFPSGFTSRSELFGSVMDHRQQFVGEHLHATAGLYSPSDWTHSSNSNAGEYTTYTLALKEGATGTQYSITAATGSYSQTGVDAEFGRTYRMVPLKGTFTTLGNAAALTYTPTALSIEADTGVYAQVGTTASFSRSYKLSANTEGYSTTGTTVSFKRTRIFHVETGAYSYSGSTATLRRHYSLLLEAGSMSYSGSATLLHDRVLQIVQHTCIMAGHPAELTWSDEGAVQAQSILNRTHFRFSIGL